ncbi:MAG: twin-arginine translocation signal domain-containing protein [Myxococcales bacterium]|nr:twin-arginine translocation signal domain-containing protein [Myxococcales bacterium]
MERRTFLQLVTGGAVAAGLGGLSHQRELITWDPTAPLFPGLPLLVGLREDAGGPCHVTVVTTHHDKRHVAEVCTLSPGEERHIEQPFPYETLVPGQYKMRLIAMRVDGSSSDRQNLGEVAVSALRFGA